MRDIRDELRARRAEAMGRYGDAMFRFQSETERLLKERDEAVRVWEEERALLDAMISMEERRVSEAEGAPVVGKPAGVSLRDFLRSRIEAGPIDRDTLRGEAEKAGLFDSGRAFNMTLQNVVSAAAFKKLPDGRFARADVPTPGLFGMGSATREAPMTAQ